MFVPGANVKVAPLAVMIDPLPIKQLSPIFICGSILFLTLASKKTLSSITQELPIEIFDPSRNLKALPATEFLPNCCSRIGRLRVLSP